MKKKSPVNPQDDSALFKEQYGKLLEKFLNDKTAQESYLHEGYKLGREALGKNISILDVAAIHHDCLINYLEKLESNEHMVISERASAYFEEILSSFQMTSVPFREAITLLNRRSLNFAGKVRALQDSLKEKESLLKEIYHRVKNNLQVVSSLLNMQADSIQDSNSKKIFLESSARVKSMSLVHELLYQSGNLAQVEMGKYLKDISRYLTEIYHVDSNLVTLTIKSDSVLLGIDEAVPCGLIINELISNAFKHAFPGGKSGEVKLLIEKKDAKIYLQVSNTGISFPLKIDFRNTKTLGLQLINALTKQLGGEITLDTKNGTTFTLIFSPTKSTRGGNGKDTRS